jgi:hypothetical protein
MPQVPEPSTDLARPDPAVEREAYMLSLDLAELTAVVPQLTRPSRA